MYKHLQEHDELFWEVLESGIKGPITLLNIDAHSDMSMFDGTLGIGNFISKMVDLGIVDRVVWVKNENSIDFNDGTYDFRVVKNGRALVSTLEDPYYFFQGSYSGSEGGRRVRLEVITDVAKIPNLESSNWILSVDCDYFSCNNPCQQDLARLVSAIGPDTLEKLYLTGKSIKSRKDWDAFAGNINSMAPGMMAAVVRCMFPQFDQDQETIAKRVLDLAGVIKPRGCQAIYSVSSLSSGFTDPNRHDFIASLLREWLTRLCQK